MPQSQVSVSEMRKLDRDREDFLRAGREYQYWLRNNPYGKAVAKQKLAIGINPYV